MANKIQTIEIQALDTLFFRDGKPFSMGEETWADGLFPPSPSVIYGALRTAWALQNDIPVNEIADKTSGLEIQKIYYELNGNIFFTLPIDLLIKKTPKKNEKKQRERENKYTAIKLNSFEDNTLSSNPFSTLITYSDNNQLENLPFGIIDKDNLVNYSQNINNDLSIKNLNDVIKIENKVGIGKNQQVNLNSDGMLYRIGLTRLENLKIFIQFSGLEFKHDIIKLGGEAKTAKIKPITDTITLKKLTFPKLSFKTNKFKIVLTSSAYFKNGHLPSWIDNEMNAKHNGYNFKLSNIIIGKSISQGGFDMRKGKPKKMVKLVPAGSVFYFEAEKEVNPEEIFNDYSISENSDEYQFSKQGFGHFIIAKI